MEDRDYHDVQAGDDPAAAFDRLRGEVALLRSAIEGLTVARRSIDIPDYQPTLARTEKMLVALVRWTASPRAGGDAHPRSWGSASTSRSPTA
jgi:hypothetical protein